MDVTTLRIGATIACFITFVGIIVWACMRSNKPAFDEAAQLPFLQD